MKAYTFSIYKASFSCLVVLLIARASELAFGRELDLLNPRDAEITLINCDVEKTAESMRFATNDEEKDALVDIAIREPTVLGSLDPLELRFRMKTAVNGDVGEYLVYWVAEGESEWNKYRRVLFYPDGEWHKYRLPLAAVGGVKVIRFTFGKQTHTVELADMQLVVGTRVLPDGFKYQRDLLPESATIAGDRLKAEFDSSTKRFSIHDSKTNRVWNSEPVSPWLELIGLEKKSDNQLFMQLFDIFDQQLLTAEVELASDDAVRFSIDSKDRSLSHFSASHFPPRFSTEMSDGHIVFCDRSCGVLLDQADKTYAHWPLRVYGNTHCLDMPWIGLFDHTRGDGMMLLVETPFDAEVALVAQDDGLHWPEVRWLPRMDSFGYQRTASLRFTTDGGYVSLAHKYRDSLKEQGRFRTLEDKAMKKPPVDRLRGAPSLWGGRYPTKFIRQMRPLGMERGIIGNCMDPGIVAWLNDMGYLTGRYDNYVDITNGENRFTSGNVEQIAARPRPGSAPKHGWKLSSGTQMYSRSSACWAEGVDSYVPGELSRIPMNSRFIDVSAAIDLTEDYHPLHTFDRRQDMENRRALFQRMNDYGVVLGTEHGNDWVTDLVEYFEGSMSGPFWWSSWPAGHLVRPSREQLSDNYLKYGMGYANRVPLWELVYHDCAVTTWYWGDTAGLLYEAAPELSDRKDLFNILYVTTPLFWMNNTGYRLPDEMHRMLRTYHDTCHLHQKLAFQQLVRHEFLSDDRAVQRSTFADGSTVTVNFADEPRHYKCGGTDCLLAPNGFMVESPGFVQQKLWIDGAAQTIIAKPDFLLVEADGQRNISGIKSKGRVTTWKTGENRWNMYVDKASSFEIDIPEVTRWSIDEGLRICHMDEIGEIHKTVAPADDAGRVHFQADDNAWRFILVRDKPDEAVAERAGNTERIPVAKQDTRAPTEQANTLKSR